jgi:hypothetical protein
MKEGQHPSHIVDGGEVPNIEKNIYSYKICNELLLFSKLFFSLMGFILFFFF